MPLQVFISYKSEYRDFARKLKARIREWGYGTWFDVDDIAEGTYFRHAIQEGLEKSEVMVGVLTEDAFRSREVQAEWDYFFIKNKEFIPLRYQAIEPPYHLLTIQYIDFINDENTAFEKLHKRLGELARVLQKEAVMPQKSGTSTAELDERGGQRQEEVLIEAPKTEAPDSLEQEKKRKREAVDDQASVEVINRLMQAQRELIQELGAEPSDEQIAVKMGFLTQNESDTIRLLRSKGDTVNNDLLRKLLTATEKVRQIIQMSQAPISLDMPQKPTKPITPAVAPADEPAPDEGESKSDALDDGLFMPPSPPPAPITRPPSPITQPANAPATPAEPLPQPIGGIQAPANAPVAQPQRQQSSYPPAQPASRPKSSPMIWPVAAAASFVVIVGVLALVATNANPTASVVTPENSTNPLVWIVGLVAVLGVAGVGIWWVRTQSARRISGIPASSSEPAITDYSLANVWEKTILQSSLLAQPAAYDLQSVLSAILRHKQYGDYNLPQSTVLVKVFDDANRELLILGERPTRLKLLQQLAHELAQASSADGSIPVLLSLSSWDDQLSLADWLVDKLKEKYGLPPAEAISWIAGEKLILLLDGLDEAADWYRTSCIDAINTFRQQHPKTDWVVGSRVADFDTLTSQLDISTAVIIPDA